APYHVARSKLFVRERGATATLIRLDTAQIEANIEHTRFPVPEDERHESTDDFPGLVRAAVLIGQLADINYLRKQTALFDEFRETGMSNKLGYNSVADLRANYPDFFWKKVRPYIGDALRYLRVTQEGQQWIANLYANVFSIEHRSQLLRCNCQPENSSNLPFGSRRDPSACFELSTLRAHMFSRKHHASRARRFPLLG